MKFIIGYVLAVFLIFTLGCTNKNTNSENTNEEIHNHDDHDHDDHNHDEEEEHDTHMHEESDESHTDLLTFMEFVDGYEVFMEMDHFVLREENDINLHLTNLSNYKPLQASEVEVRINNDSKLTIHAHSHGKGIYHFVIRPGSLKKLNITLAFKEDNKQKSIELPAFLVYQDRSMAPSTPTHSDDVVTFTKEMAWNTDFMLQKIALAPFSRVVKTSGQIVPSSSDEEIVNALHAGIISFNENLVEGIPVSKGTVIGNISSDLIHQNLNTHFLKAQGEYEKAKLNYERARKLLDEKLITEMDFLEVQLNYQNAKNEYDNISRYYSGGQKHLVAPFNGFIRSVFVKQGQFVEEGQPIVSVIKNTKSMLKADLPQQYNHLVSGIYQANFSPVYTSEVFNTKDLNGKRINISNVLPINSMFVPVYFEFDAQEDIIPGSYAEVYLRSSKEHMAISLPSTALMEDQGNYYVYVMLTGDEYTKTYVSIGDSDGEHVEIKDGLKTGDVVVTKGTYQVYLASLSKAAPAHTHSH